MKTFITALLLVFASSVNAAIITVYNDDVIEVGVDAFHGDQVNFDCTLTMVNGACRYGVILYPSDMWSGSITAPEYMWLRVFISTSAGSPILMPADGFMLEAGTTFAFDVIGDDPNGSGYTLNVFWEPPYVVEPFHLGLYDVLPASSAVPVPSAVWLFGSGLLGLIGVARQRRSI